MLQFDTILRMPGNLPDVDFSSWPTPNYVDPVERTWMPAYSITLTVASSIPILIRLFLRFRNEGGGLGLDDVGEIILIRLLRMLTSSSSFSSCLDGFSISGSPQWLRMPPITLL